MDYKNGRLLFLDVFHVHGAGLILADFDDRFGVDGDDRGF